MFGTIFCLLNCVPELKESLKFGKTLVNFIAKTKDHKINTALGEFLYMNSASFEVSYTQIIEYYLTHEKVPLDFKYELLMILARNGTFLARIGKEKMCSKELIDCVNESLKTKDEKQIQKWFKLLSKFMTNSEFYENTAVSVASQFIFYFDFALQKINEIPQSVLEDFISPILFCLRFAPAENIRQLFVKEQGSVYFNFLLQLLHRFTSNDQISEKSDQCQYIKFYGSQEEENEALKQRSSANKEGNQDQIIKQKLFVELSLRYLRLICSLLGEKNSRNTDVATNEIITLLINLLAPEQSPDLYLDTSLIISRLFVSQKQALLFNSSFGMDNLYSVIWSLCFRTLRVARATGVGLLGHLLYVDYSNSRGVLATSHSMLLNLRKIAPILPDYKMPLMNKIIERMHSFVRGFKLKVFISKAEDRINAIQTIVSLLHNSDQNSGKLMKVADLFYVDPRQRLEILRECIKKDDEYSTHRAICSMMYKLLKATPKVFLDSNVPKLKLDDDKTEVPEKNVIGAAMGSEITLKTFIEELKLMGESAKDSKRKEVKENLKELKNSVSEDDANHIDQILSAL